MSNAKGTQWVSDLMQMKFQLVSLPGRLMKSQRVDNDRDASSPEESYKMEDDEDEIRGKGILVEGNCTQIKDRSNDSRIWVGTREFMAKEMDLLQYDSS